MDAALLVHREQVGEQVDLGVDDVVAQEHGEGLVPDVLARHRHGVTEPEWLFLHDELDVGQRRDRADSLELRLLARRLERLLEIVAAPEVLLERAVARADDHHDVAQPGADRLLDDVLDSGLVDDCEHALGLCLGCREEARAEAGRGDDRLAGAGGAHVLGERSSRSSPRSRRPMLRE